MDNIELIADVMNPDGLIFLIYKCYRLQAYRLSPVHLVFIYCAVVVFLFEKMIFSSQNESVFWKRRGKVGFLNFKKLPIKLRS